MKNGKEDIFENDALNSPKYSSCDNLLSEDVAASDKTIYDEELDSVTSSMKSVGAKTIAERGRDTAWRSKGTTEKFASYVSESAKHSMAGYILTSYNENDTFSKRFKSSRKDGIIKALVSKISNLFASGAASSFLIGLLEDAMGKLLTLKLKIFGIFLATFGSYTFVYYLFVNFFVSEKREVLNLLFGAAMIVLSFPLLLSNDTLSHALRSSGFGRAVKNACGIHSVSINRDGEYGKANVGFAAGVFAALLSMLTSPQKTVFLIIAIMIVFLVFSKPEFGVVMTAFLLPFSTTSLIFICLTLTLLSLCVKLIRKKRFLYFEMLDFSVLAVLVIFSLSFVGTHKEGVLSKSLEYAVLLLAYFLTVNLLKNRLWLERVSCALVLGISSASAMYLLATFANRAFGGVSSALATFFPSSVLSSALCSAPETLCYMCVTAVPVSISLLMSPSVKAGKFHTVISLLVLILPIIENFSKYYVVALLPAIFLLLIIYSKKNIWIPIFGVAAFSASYFVFPKFFEKFSQYFMSFFKEISDKGLFGWKDIIFSSAKCFFGGTGYTGQMFLYEKSKVTPNTYISIMLETGVFGFVIFAIFTWLFITASFTMLSAIEASKKSSALKTGAVKINTPDSLGSFKHLKKGIANQALTLNQYCISRKIGVAAPFCSTFALMLCGLGENIFLDERLFTLFWIITGLCAAYIRTSRRDIQDMETSYLSSIDSRSFSQIDIELK